MSIRSNNLHNKYLINKYQSTYINAFLNSTILKQINNTQHGHYCRLHNKLQLTHNSLSYFTIPYRIHDPQTCQLVEPWLMDLHHVISRHENNNNNVIFDFLFITKYFMSMYLSPKLLFKLLKEDTVAVLAQYIMIGISI